MKALNPSSPPPQRMRRAELRRLEQDLGVFFDVPKAPKRSLVEQYAVYDDAEVYVGDVQASAMDGGVFTYTSLKVATVRLFGRCGYLFDGGPLCCLRPHHDWEPHTNVPPEGS